MNENDKSIEETEMQFSVEPIINEDSISVSPPKRNTFVTIWLIFVPTIYTFYSLVYLFARHSIEQKFNITFPIIIVYVILCELNVMFFIQLLSWKKIGFLGFLITHIIGFILDFHIGLSLIKCSIGAIDIIVLLTILQIKKNGISAWNNLK